MKVNDIFLSIQGEGFNTGAAAVFVRLAGCNLRCPFCDTDFLHGREMSEEAVVAYISKYDCRTVVLTGGEPTLQITRSFLQLLKGEGWRVWLETNGTRDLPAGMLSLIDWVTVSPKEEHVAGAEAVISRIDELKVIYSGQDISRYDRFVGKVPNLFIQPCDTGDERKNRGIFDKCYEFVKDNVRWRLSLQIQKVLSVQ